MADIFPYKQIFIQIMNDTNRNGYIGTKYFNATFRINSKNAFGNIFRFEIDKNYNQFTEIKKQKHIEWKIFDRDLNLINFNGCDFEMILEKV